MTHLFILIAAGVFGAIAHSIAADRFGRRTFGYAFTFAAVGALYEIVIEPLLVILIPFYPIGSDNPDHIVWQSALMMLGAFSGTALIDSMWIRWHEIKATGDPKIMTGEFKSALLRGIFHACLVSLTSLLYAWNDPNIPWRSLVSITVLPGLTVLGTRFIGEGWYDTVKKQGNSK